MAIKACEILGLSKNKISKCLGKLNNAKREIRASKIFPDGTKAFIDFAHTPDAIDYSNQCFKRSF